MPSRSNSLSPFILCCLFLFFSPSINLPFLGPPWLHITLLSPRNRKIHVTTEYCVGLCQAFQHDSRRIGLSQALQQQPQADLIHRRVRSAHTKRYADCFRSLQIFISAYSWHEPSLLANPS
ncbi:hypothetical protein B0J18DRAFT_285763 [Chaetomium sp. MPI-SDFR-AT-0129]|nr:hypothetical protein B0J18DRAFT_285763 [Chaetomium sp. MPI-SDFR-AT-0129]